MAAALALLLPSFLKRKRSAEEEEARALRAALAAAPRSAVVGKCLELYAANQGLARRVGEMERAVAARDDAATAAMRDAVRDEVALFLAPRWTFCAEGASEPDSDSGDEPCDVDTGTEASGDEVSLDVEETSSSDDDDSSSDSFSSSSEEEEEEQQLGRAPSAQLGAQGDDVRATAPQDSDDDAVGDEQGGEAMREGLLALSRMADDSA